jgi:rhodanese-related sulfurtransferase
VHAKLHADDTEGTRMRTIHTTSLALLLLLPIPIGCSGGDGGSHRVASAEAHALVEAGATLLDVRTEAEWSAGHLPGAVLIPVGELGARIAEVPRDRPVVVYCQSGGRSAQAAEMLASAGYDVHDLGGIGSW